MPSRVATNNLLKTVYEDGTDLVFIQEKYVLHNKVAGIPRKHKIYATGEGRHRAGIVVTNNQLHSVLLRQLSDEDTVALEVINDKTKTIVTSMHFDIDNLKT